MIYLDNAATTATDKEVFEAMKPYLTTEYGNPGSMHEIGLKAKQALDRSRETVAKIIGASPSEIIFTGSGTESDNLGILGFARKNKDKGNHIISTKIEHHAVELPLKQLEKEGFEVTYLSVDKGGLVDPKKLAEAITPKTILISIIYANNEIGTVQDLSKLKEVAKGISKEIVFHTDACQAAGYLPIDIPSLGIELMTLNGSKIYGPKGVGILYKKQNIKLEPIIYGGGQEFGLRSGTENIANIVGFTKALELISKQSSDKLIKLTELRDELIKGLLEIPETILNGHPIKRLPNNVNISFLNVEGESLLLMLGEEGIYASTGSACSSKSLEVSHVHKALGLPDVLAHGSIRYTLGKETTKEDIETTIETTKKVVAHLRKMSPLKMTIKEVMK